jgi:hypothetical protein
MLVEILKTMRANALVNYYRDYPRPTARDGQGQALPLQGCR